MADEADTEIAAIFTRLKDEVRSRPDLPRHSSAESTERSPLPARSRAERAWAVTAERDFENRPTPGGRVRGLILAPVKRVLRKLMRWYVEPVAAHQRTFNLAILTLVDELIERTDTDVARIERRLAALEARAAPGPADPEK